MITVGRIKQSLSEFDDEDIVLVKSNKNDYEILGITFATNKDSKETECVIYIREN